jgi:hypothetical protein
MTFPALVPSARTYIPGDLPQTRQVALSGVDSAYRLGNRRVEQQVTLTFNNISEANLLSIRSHYISMDGTYGIFYLPSEVWSGYATPPVPLLSDYAWRYAGPPTITDGSCDLWSVEVELVSYAINFSDLIIDAGGAAATPARTYILDAGAASATPARDYVINPGASA